MSGRCLHLAGMTGLLILLPSLALPAADAGKSGKKPPPAIEAIAWLAGNWRLEQAGRVVEEQWMAPAAGVMLGMSRTVAKGRVTGHEFMQIRVGPGGDLFYIAQPSGQKEAAFQHTLLTDREAAFANPNHDFPQKITYTLNADGSMLAVLEGPRDDGTTRRVELPFQRVK